jgi:hypothetical protein
MPSLRRSGGHDRRSGLSPRRMTLHALGQPLPALRAFDDMVGAGGGRDADLGSTRASKDLGRRSGRSWWRKHRLRRTARRILRRRPGRRAWIGWAQRHRFLADQALHRRPARGVFQEHVLAAIGVRALHFKWHSDAYWISRLLTKAASRWMSSSVRPALRWISACARLPPVMSRAMTFTRPFES